MDSVKKYLERSDKIKAQEELEGITVSQTVEIFENEYPGII